MEKSRQIEKCMIKQCNFCRKKGKCDKEVLKDNYKNIKEEEQNSIK